MAKARQRHHTADPKKKPTERRRAAPPDWRVVALAVVGLVVTGYLTATAWWGTLPALCDAESGCAIVQNSRWSVFLGLPIALWGFLVYAAIAVVAAQSMSRLKRWRWLWRLSLFGLAISVYLTLVGLLALQAACLWCLLSLLTIAAIFVLVHVGRPESAPGIAWRGWLLNNGAIALVLVAILHLYFSGLLSAAENPRLKALATHLDESGVKYYGAFWCPVCQQQGKLFGASAERLPYIECHPGGRSGPVALECVSAQIPGFPTWVIRGRQHNQLMQPEELARLSGFDWDGFQERGR